MAVRKILYSALVAGSMVLAGIPLVNAQTKAVIGVSLPNLQGAWHTAIVYGMTDEAEKLGLDIIIQDSGGYANVAKQLDQISNLIARKVSVMLVEPADPSALNNVVRQVREAGIFIVGAGVNDIASEEKTDAAASSSHCAVGLELAKGAKSLLPEGGTIGILAGPSGAFWATDRVRCFKKDLEGFGFKIVADLSTEQDAAVSLSTATDILQRNPDLDLFYGAGDTYGVGAARAVQNAGRCGKTKVIFGILGEAAEEMMRAGCVDYIAALQPVLVGRTTVRIANEYIKKGSIDKKIHDVGMIAVTPENLATVDKTTMTAPEGWRP